LLVDFSENFFSKFVRCIFQRLAFIFLENIKNSQLSIKSAFILAAILSSKTTIDLQKCGAFPQSRNLGSENGNSSSENVNANKNTNI